MLWGGLLMAIALLLCLSFLGNRTRLWGALIGGVGFGFFIDEIGKFITRDNNYFYQPSVALIYITFVLIYLAFRDLQLRRVISREEYLVNALNDFEEAIINDLQPEERDRARRYLAAVTTQDELTRWGWVRSSTVPACSRGERGYHITFAGTWSRGTKQWSRERTISADWSRCSFFSS
jgi:hypothetical protein